MKTPSSGKPGAAGSKQGRGPPPSAPRPQEGSRVGSGFSTTRKRGLPAMPSTRDHAQHSRRSLTGGLFFAQTHSSELRAQRDSRESPVGGGTAGEEAQGVCYPAGSPAVKTPFLQYGDTSREPHLCPNPFYPYGRYGEAQMCTNCSTQHSEQGTIGERENETWTRRGMGASRRAHDRMVFRL